MKLTRWENQWAEAAIGAIFPGLPEEGFADVSSMDVPGFLHNVLHSVPFRAALGLRLAIWLAALAPIFMLGRMATISAATLPRSDREQAIARLVASPRYAIRSLSMILKAMGALLYAGNDAVRARMRVPAPSRSVIPLRVRRAHSP